MPPKKLIRSPSGINSYRFQVDMGGYLPFGWEAFSTNPGEPDGSNVLFYYNSYDDISQWQEPEPFRLLIPDPSSMGDLQPFYVGDILVPIIRPAGYTPNPPPPPNSRYFDQPLEEIPRDQTIQEMLEASYAAFDLSYTVPATDGFKPTNDPRFNFSLQECADIKAFDEFVLTYLYNEDDESRKYQDLHREIDDGLDDDFDEQDQDDFYR